MSAHLIKAMMLRTVEARAVCQWVCREKSELINEMNKVIKDGQERKVRELLVLMGVGVGEVLSHTCYDPFTVLTNTE